MEAWTWARVDLKCVQVKCLKKGLHVKFANGLKLFQNIEALQKQSGAGQIHKAKDDDDQRHREAH